MRQINGYWYIFWTNTVRDSLHTKDKDLAAQVFNVRRRERRDEELQKLGPKTCPALSDFIAEYKKYRESDGCAESTVDNDILSLSSLRAFTGDMLLSDISRRDIDLFHADLQKPKIVETKTGKQIRTQGCRRTSVNAYIRHIKHAFYKAQEWGYIEKNPYEKYKPYDEPEQPFKELTDLEIREKLLPAIKEDDFRAMIQMYLQVGARASELCTAHRDWVVEIEDRNGVPRKWLIFPETKRHQSRKVPIGEDLETIIEKLPREGYLFPRWRKPQSVSHKLKKILRSTGAAICGCTASDTTPGQRSPGRDTPSRHE